MGGLQAPPVCSHCPSVLLALCITGFDADPDRVTDILEIEPTRVARKGELSKSGRVNTFNGWWLEGTGNRLAGGEEHASVLTQILHRLNGREEKFALLRKQIQPKSVTIYGGIYVHADTQCGVFLDPPDMRLLADCGIGWGLEVFTAD